MDHFEKILLESSPDCFKILDEEGRLEFMNHNGLCQMEIDDFKMVGNQYWWDLWGTEQKDTIFQSVQQAKHGEKVQFTAFCETAKGTPKWWEVLIYAIQTADGKQKFISISRDITELKELNSKLSDLNQNLEQQIEDRTKELQKLNDDLVTTNQELELFNHISSHDLQEPLRKIQMFMSRLATEKDEEKQQVYHQKVSTTISGMRELLVSLRTLAKAKKISELKDNCDLNKILSKTLQKFTESQNLKMQVSLPKELPIVSGHAFLLGQLFDNIFSNAIKFKHPQQPLTISISYEEVVNEGVVCGRISFKDNGIGFESQYQEKVLLPFKKFHPHTNLTGSGLGLAICNTIMQNHNGFIKAHSTLNQGCTIELYFPISEINQPITKIAL